jgi:hypothetical protein
MPIHILLLTSITKVPDKKIAKPERDTSMEFGGLSRKVGVEDSSSATADVIHSLFSIARIIKPKQHLSLWKVIRCAQRFTTQPKSRPYVDEDTCVDAALSTFS